MHDSKDPKGSTLEGGRSTAHCPGTTEDLKTERKEKKEKGQKTPSHLFALYDLGLKIVTSLRYLE